MRFLILSIFLFLDGLTSLAQENSFLSNENILIQHVEQELELVNLPPSCSNCSITIDGKTAQLIVNEEGESWVNLTLTESTAATISTGNDEVIERLSVVPLWLSLVPPL